MGSVPPPGGDMGSVPPPGGDMGSVPPPGGDMGSVPPPGGDTSDEGSIPPPNEDMGMESQGEEQGDVSIKSIQKLVGKLSQKLRSMGDEDMDSKDIKYVLNSIISAIDLDKIEDEDKEEILSRFESDDEEDVEGMDVEDEVDEPEMKSPKPPSSSELDEEDELTNKFGDAVKSRFATGLTKAHPLSKELGEREIGAIDNILEKLFSESKVDRVLSNYFGNKTTKKSLSKEIERLSENIDQELKAKSLITKLPNVKFVGKTNKNNLVFEHYNKQYKVTRTGKII
jgi:hypothetical protein